MDDLQPDLSPVPGPETGTDSAGIHARLISLLQEMYDAQQAIVLTLSEAERQANGSFDNWSFKDTLAHIVAWTDVMNRRLDLLARGEMPVDYEDVDQVNAEFYQARLKLSWSAVLESSRKSFTGLIERLQSFTAAQLLEPGQYAWLNGRPLWQRIINSAYVHPQIHLALYYQQHGRSELGLQMQQMAAERLLALDSDPVWRSQVHYNLACLYALNGNAPAAIELLRLALQLNSDLLDWSQQDPDFNAIREEPAFQAIYSDFDV